MSRLLGRAITRLAAFLTLGRMPPFVSASVIVRREDQVLGILDPIRGEPVLPGGHLKWRESPDEAAKREALEETGYGIRDLSLISVVSGEEWTDEPGIVRLIYSAEIAGGELRSSGEGEARWFSVEEFLSTATRDAKVLRLWRKDAGGDCGC